MQHECLKQKVVVFLSMVTLYLIWNPKPDKDNTCTTIHFHEGDTPLRTACRPFLPCVLRTAMFWPRVLRIVNTPVTLESVLTRSYYVPEIL